MRFPEVPRNHQQRNRVNCGTAFRLWLFKSLKKPNLAPAAGVGRNPGNQASARDSALAPCNCNPES